MSEENDRSKVGGLSPEEVNEFLKNLESLPETFTARQLNLSRGQLARGALAKEDSYKKMVATRNANSPDWADNISKANKRPCTADGGKTVYESKRALVEALGWDAPNLSTFRYLNDFSVAESVRKKLADAAKGKARPAIAEAHSRRCTVDGVTIYPSMKALRAALGHGIHGARHPDFRYLDTGYEAKVRPCTIDGKKIYPSLRELIADLGQGKAGSKNPKLRFLPAKRAVKR